MKKAIDTMVAKNVSGVIIVEDGDIVGTVTERDILNWFFKVLRG
ncbi:MAG: CBS domain-containing protein [Nitrososphaerales archaeon]|nr:CBS domain-containing protein [Nitrososphaerales archaeon]